MKKLSIKYVAQNMLVSITVKTITYATKRDNTILNKIKGYNKNKSIINNNHNQANNICDKIGRSHLQLLYLCLHFHLN